MKMKIAPELLGDLSKALQDAFPTTAKLDAMLLFRFGINRETIALGNDLGDIVLRIIITYQANDETSDLLIKAREANPKNAKLLDVARRAGLAVQTLVEDETTHTFVPALNAQQRGLERTIVEANTQLDVNVWRNRLGEIEGRVCRIEYRSGGNSVTGTGFLVAANVVLTNYHVMEDVITGNVRPQDVALRFDYKMLPDGMEINSGTIVRLAAGDTWKIDYSPYSQVDTLVDASGREPASNELDYALLLIESEIGNLPLGANPQPTDPPRGWIWVSDQPYNFVPDTALFILQHPDGAPLKLALDTEAIIGVNAGRTRVRYRTNTESGSSGAPCFNGNLDLIALHHSGDPNYETLHKPTYNQGIPIDVVRALVKSNGRDSYFGN